MSGKIALPTVWHHLTRQEIMSTDWREKKREKWGGGGGGVRDGGRMRDLIKKGWIKVRCRKKIEDRRCVKRKQKWRLLDRQWETEAVHLITIEDSRYTCLLNRLTKHWPLVPQGVNFCSWGPCLCSWSHLPSNACLLLGASFTSWYSITFAHPCGRCWTIVRRSYCLQCIPW